jgi:hypothetical protein
MTLIQVATLLIRIICISFFLDAVIVLTEIPVMIADILKSQFDYIKSEREFALAMIVVRFFIYVGGGVCLSVFARPLGRLFAKGLDKHD